MAIRSVTRGTVGMIWSAATIVRFGVLRKPTQATRGPRHDLHSPRRMVGPPDAPILADAAHPAAPQWRRAASVAEASFGAQLGDRPSKRGGQQFDVVLRMDG